MTDLPLTEINTLIIVVMVFIHRNEIRHLWRRVDRLEDALDATPKRKRRSKC